MTSFLDNIRSGRANYGRATPPGTGYAEDEIYGVPFGQTFPYQIGTASTALASGVFYSASGATGGTLTATGALVSGGVATFDVARGLRFTSSVDTSTSVITVRGTDLYGAPITYSINGPTGNTIGNVGSYVDSLVTFKTVTTASAVGNLGTTLFMIGDNNCFGLPYRIANVGKGLDVYINGSSATVPATWAAGYTTTAAATASTADVRGTVTLSTVVLANDARYITAVFITPNWGIAASSDTKENTYGVAPYTA
jgi:hypothetical protein